MLPEHKLQGDMSRYWEHLGRLSFALDFEYRVTDVAQKLRIWLRIDRDQNPNLTRWALLVVVRKDSERLKLKPFA